MTPDQAEDILQRIEAGQEVSVYCIDGEWGFRRRPGGGLTYFQYHPYDDPADGAHDLSREESRSALLVYDYEHLLGLLRGPIEPGKAAPSPSLSSPPPPSPPPSPSLSSSPSPSLSGPPVAAVPGVVLATPPEDGPSPEPRRPVRSRAIEGWPLVGWAALGAAVLVAGVLGTQGTGREGLLLAVRLTARVDVVLFLCAFVASSLHRLLRSAFTAWLLRNRRYVGVSFAVVHFTHLGVIAALASLAPADFVRRTPTVTFVGGGLAYLLLAGMTVTSFDRSAAWLGHVWWRRLHVAGSYLLWLVFLQSYAKRAPRDPVPHALLALAVVAALAVRVWARRRPRRAEL